MSTIITEEMVQEAIQLARPTAEAVLQNAKCFWGPQWVRGLVRAPGLNDIPFTFGTVVDWNPAWGENRGFEQIAQAKLEVAHRLGGNTSHIVEICP